MFNLFQFVKRVLGIKPKENTVLARKKLNTVEHRDRKNPRSAEIHAERRVKINGLRPKQVYNPVTKEWERAS